MPEWLRSVFEILKMAALAFLIVAPIRYFLFQPFVVSGSSMSPSFEDGDYLLIDEVSYRFREPKRGEVIVFRAPPRPSSRYIKRIVGLPGETVEIQKEQVLVRNGEGTRTLPEPYLANGVEMENRTVALKEDEYFVLGDNRNFSSDSRSWGPLAERYIVGRAFFRALPLSRAGPTRRPRYGLGAFLNQFCLSRP